MRANQIFPRLMERLANYRRILQVARKPTKDEFLDIARICTIGIGLIGAVGFTTYALSILFIG